MPVSCRSREELGFPMAGIGKDGEPRLTAISCRRRTQTGRQKQLVAYGMLASMNRKGNCWDNAVSESFFNSLKNEPAHGSRYETRDEARADLFDYVEVFYDRSRRHSALGGQSPAVVYAAWLKFQSKPKLAA